MISYHEKIIPSVPSIGLENGPSRNLWPADNAVGSKSRDYPKIRTSDERHPGTAT